MSLILKSCFLIFALLFGQAFAETQTVNVNRADATRLAEVLDGVGQSRAEAIVRYRASNGQFDTVMDLAKVKGIGVDTVERNQSRIRLTD